MMIGLRCRVLLIYDEKTTNPHVDGDYAVMFSVQDFNNMKVHAITFGICFLSKKHVGRYEQYHCNWYRKKCKKSVKVRLISSV